MIKQLTVTGRIIINKQKKMSIIYDQELLDFVSKLNFSITPLNLNNNINYDLLKQSKGLIMSGGGDIYNVSKKKIDKIRDNIELKLYNYFKKNNKPILAICRGFQLVINFNGGTIKKIRNHVRKSHDVKVIKSNYIRLKKINVNSFHKFGLFDNVNDFRKTGVHRDGSIEILEHKTKKILCVMFHPERMMKSKIKIFSEIVKFFR